jgi:hypothetical protein
MAGLAPMCIRIRARVVDDFLSTVMAGTGAGHDDEGTVGHAKTFFRPAKTT